jgi:hypothetical protein
MVLWFTFDEPTGSTAYNPPGAFNGTRYDGSAVAGSGNGPAHQLSSYVLNSLCFDGFNDYVSVPSYPAINFGAGDFSLDAWILRGPNDAGTRVIAEKFQGAANIFMPILGYSLYLQSGVLVFKSLMARR